MKQLVQTLKNGEIQVIDVPIPILNDGMILVKNFYSIISPGTEGSSLRIAKKSLIGKARERPQQVKQVIGVLKHQGPLQTYRAVKKKLDAYSPLGYSAAGKIIEVVSDVEGFVAEDLVACGGAGYANHAEIVAVPQNLCVKLQPDADLRKAAYNTLGAIALQGVRQADLNIGENCAVVGLGLIGQLTCLILRASGIKIIGIDINERMVKIAREHCTDLAFRRDETALVEKIEEFSEGVGVDAVIITAATRSLDPINFAGKISRKKGRVVIVGDVPTGFDREPFYKKELELRMSCSYGPGRYDANYEEKGVDYPVGHVRWTEKRNMQAFQELVYTGRINIDYLTTHVFDLKDAPKAYDLILNRKEPFLGILIRNDPDKIEVERKVAIKKRMPVGKVNVAFIGAGNYAMSHLLPNLPKKHEVVFRGVMDSMGTASKKAAEKYGFEFCTSDEDDIFRNDDINTVFIATRHNSHADYVIKSLNGGKNAYVEKPLCLTKAELEEIKKVYTSVSSRSIQPLLLVGFNRRFSPLTKIVKERIGDGPAAMIYRINAGHIPSDSWIQDKETGGGRVVGEVCHFVDYLTFLNGSLPEFVFATVMPDPENNEDTLNVSLRFLNGSIGMISYLSEGSKSLFKEYIEVYKAGTTCVIKDFKELKIYGKERIKRKKLLNQDKGQKIMINEFMEAIKKGSQSPIAFDEIYSATLTTFKIIESIRRRKGIQIT